MEHANSDNNGTLSPAQQSMMAEWQKMAEHVERNVSDHSSFQHFQYVLLKMSGWYVVQECSSWSAWQADEGAKGKDETGVVLGWDRKALHTRRRSGRGRIYALEQWFKQRQIHRQQQLDRLQRQAEPSMETVAEDDQREERLMQEHFVHKLWQREADRVKQLIKAFPGHETLWYHLRFVYYGLRWLDSGVADGESIVAAVATATECVSPTTERLFVQQILGKNFENVDVSQSGVVNNNNESHMASPQSTLAEALEAQQEFANRYLTWINRLDFCDG
ncbi:hypothetical protein BGW41_005374 [Actinomortierella wolfii]|nr:hypothetical protein BGW41_005374 [Actinomortierella wolfii]